MVYLHSFRILRQLSLSSQNGGVAQLKIPMMHYDVQTCVSYGQCLFIGQQACLSLIVPPQALNE